MDKELKEIKEQMRQAEQNFNYADSEHVDAAIMDLNAAEERFRARVREVKRDDDNRGSDKAIERFKKSNIN